MLTVKLFIFASFAYNLHYTVIPYLLQIVNYNALIKRKRCTGKAPTLHGIQFERFFFHDKIRLENINSCILLQVRTIVFLFNFVSILMSLV